MSIRSMLVAAALAFTFLEVAHADGSRPIGAMSIDLGEVSGVAYYTVERDGFHVVTTLAQGTAGTSIRVVSVLAPGQSVAFLNSARGRCARNQPQRRQGAGPQGKIALELKFGPIGASHPVGGRDGGHGSSRPRTRNAHRIYFGAAPLGGPELGMGAVADDCHAANACVKTASPDCPFSRARIARRLFL